MKIITINLSERQVKALGVLQDLGLYPSRSEAIRVAIRDFLGRKFLNGEDSGTIGADSPPSSDVEPAKQEIEERKIEITRLLRRLAEESPETADAFIF